MPFMESHLLMRRIFHLLFFGHYFEGIQELFIDFILDLLFSSPLDFFLKVIWLHRTLKLLSVQPLAIMRFF